MKLSRLIPLACTVAIALALSACQSAPDPTATPTVAPTGADDAQASDVDTSAVTGAEATAGLVDPCSLLTVDEIETATGVAVTAVVRGEVKSDGSQLCAYAMDAQGSTAAALAGVPSLPPGELGDIVNGLASGGAVIGVLLSAQDPDVDYSATSDEPSDDDGDDDGDDDSESPVTPVPLDLGKGGVVVPTPNGGAAIVANDQNVLLTIMDLIAGPASPAALTSLITSAYGRL